MFAVKGGRFITHMKRLKDVKTPLANFFASGLLRLEEKLGPILWQVPPNFRYDRERLSAFFSLLPRDTQHAASLARKHDERLRGRSWTRTGENRPLRHALEVRHPSFENPDFIALLREHDIAMVVADTAGKWPLIEDTTSSFVYVRLHGDEELYVSGYTNEALERWSRKIAAWASGRTPASARLVARRCAPASSRDVFVYFDNDVKVHAPFDAITLAHHLKISLPPPAAPDFSKIREEARKGWPPITPRWRQQALAHLSDS